MMDFKDIFVTDTGATYRARAGRITATSTAGPLAVARRVARKVCPDGEYDLVYVVPTAEEVEKKIIHFRVYP